MRLFVFSVCAVGLGVTIAGAQQTMRKEPARYTGPDRVSAAETRPPGLRLGMRKPREFALASLSESERAQLAEPSPRLKTGIRRTLPPHALAAGTWETTASGSRLWRLSIHSPGSRGMRVEFDNFAAGAGRVWVYDGETVAGPYSGAGLYDDGHFYSAAVFSSTAIVEYEPAPGAPLELQPPFEIRAISHQVRTAMDQTAGVKDPADYCELDVNCYADWKSSLSSVGMISFIDNGNELLCSGSLVATRDNSFKPYFLTAGHCVNNEAAARTVQAYWTYQTPACGGTPPTSPANSLKSTAGAHLVSFSPVAGGDFSLILLNDAPSGTTFAGWDVADPPFSSALTAIHHPSGSWKRISFGNRTADATNDVQGLTADSSLFLQVEWTAGRVEHGSSGSPLFSAPGIIVGSLSYGEVLEDGTVCRINPSVAGYSRFSNTYSYISDYLENLPAELVAPSQPKVTFTMANHAVPPAQTVQLTTQSTGQVAYKLRSDASWIKLTTSMTGILSAKTPATVGIAIDPAELSAVGTYTGTVTILSGAAPPQYINVCATVRVDQSNVVASITPNPVPQDGGQWGFQIRLAETAGFATRLTALKFNGADFTSSINTWFGASRIPANGSIVAPLTGTGLFPAGDQYFEFWGVDETSGQPWYRVATVTFR
jgi:hypothetical protein